MAEGLLCSETSVCGTAHSAHRQTTVPGQVESNDEVDVKIVPAGETAYCLSVADQSANSVKMLGTVLSSEAEADGNKNGRLEVLAAAEAIQQDALGAKSGAEHVHTYLHAYYWGISHDQFKAFVQSVRGAIADKTLENPKREELIAKKKEHLYYEDWKFNDNRYGPNMYIVNSCFTMPVTQQPDMLRGIPFLSYSLMQNSAEGLACELFISHAWAEGLFDLETSLASKWPESCRGAYFCCLSNPQHLEDLIERVCSTPTESPFYKVLRQQPAQLLIVANRNTPIHTRLWCVYEAFCAYDMHIPVVVAGDPHLLITNRGKLQCMACCVESSGPLCAAFMLFGPVVLLILGFACIIYFAIGDIVAGVLCLLAAILGCLTFGGAARCIRIMNKGGGRSIAAEIAFDVRSAQCSKEKDEKAIKAEIDDQVAAVNKMLRDKLGPLVNRINTGGSPNSARVRARAGRGRAH